MDQKARIAELKRRAQEAAGGDMVCWELEGLDPDVRERFWAGVAAIETAARRPLARRLEESGFELPPPGELNRPALRRALRALIDRLAEWRYFLAHTDHLSDRELYTLLREEVLVRPEPELPPESGCNVLIDLSRFDLGEPPGTILLRYHADEELRRAFALDRPGARLPAHEDPPYDRDRRLPAPSRGPLIIRPPFVDDDEPAIVIH
jgi:hypothetical protein